VTVRDRIARWPDRGPHLRSVLRITAAAMFMTAGTMKLFAFPAGVPPDGGTVALASQIGFGAVLEVVGGALLLAGLFTRPAAFLLSGEMAVAYFQFHAPQGFWPIVNGGTEAVLYCFLWLYYSAAGPGPWSLDALIGTRRASRAAPPSR
jgi:putative oxidoreductase